MTKTHSLEQSQALGELAHANPLAELHRLRDEHPLWSCRLFRACRDGVLDRDDFRYVFSQYQLYSRSFTRFLAALMAGCDDDLFRSRLSMNLWDEGGGCDPEQRHAELFRRFLRDSLDIPAPAATDYEVFTRHFVGEYLASCGGDSTAASAFLSLGTESIVPRMYEMFITGLTQAGLRRDELEFFHIHISCDDDHAATIEQLMLTGRRDTAWFETCRDAMLRALDLRLQFFEQLIDGLQRRRLGGILGRIDQQQSLCPARLVATDVRHRVGDAGPELYANRVESEGIEFAVTRIPLAAEVLDPRRVTIPPGKRNEHHRHAHETFLYFTEGRGRVQVDAMVVDVAAGDCVLVPRWALHQTENTGSTPLCFVAVTDYRLTNRAFLGDAKAYRRDERANLHRQEAAPDKAT